MQLRTMCAALAVGAFIAANAAAQAMPDVSKTANPELVGELAQGLSVTPQQAEGAAGALFGAAKQNMPASDWTKVSAAVPGMDGLLKAAPMMAAAGGTGGSGASSVAGVAAATGAMGKTGGLATAAASFSKLGLKPDMVSKALPIVTKYVSKTGGAGVGSLLAGALK